MSSSATAASTTAKPFRGGFVLETLAAKRPLGRHRSQVVMVYSLMVASFEIHTSPCRRRPWFFLAWSGWLDPPRIGGTGLRLAGASLSLPALVTPRLVQTSRASF